MTVPALSRLMEFIGLHGLAWNAFLAAVPHSPGFVEFNFNQSCGCFELEGPEDFSGNPVALYRFRLYQERIIGFTTPERAFVITPEGVAVPL